MPSNESGFRVYVMEDASTVAYSLILPPRKAGSWKVVIGSVQTMEGRSLLSHMEHMWALTLLLSQLRKRPKAAHGISRLSGVGRIPACCSCR